jgi:tetratricopeptide (TPR) repeat protein
MPRVMKRKSVVFTAVLLAGTLAVVLVSGRTGPLMGGSPLAGVQDTAQTRIEAVRLNTLGVANMTQQRTGAALELFEEAYRTDASFTTARLNEAIARFNLQQFEQADQILSEITNEDPDNARAWYNLGLAYRTLGRSSEAVAAFEHVVALDPADADSHYLLGQMRSLIQQYDEAIASFDNAIALSPYHASATYGLAGVYRMQGQVDQALDIFARFNQITAEDLSVLFGSAYGDQGPYSLAEDASDLAQRPSNTIEVQFVQANGLDFVHETDADSASGILGGGVCVLDYDADDAADLFLADGGESAGRLYRNLGNFTFEDVTESAGLNVAGPGLGCTAGDFDNDTLIDLAIGTPGGVTLLRNTGAGTFEDVSATAGIEIGDADTGIPLGLSFIDFDHDSDVDLYVVRSNGLTVDGGQVIGRAESAPANMLWRNNGNGTFTDWTSETALSGVAAGIGAVGTDINNDRAIDLVLTGWGNSPEIFLNPRAGEFTRLDWTGGDAPLMPTGVVVADFNKDTWMDLAFTERSAPGLSVWQNVEGETFDRVGLPSPNWLRGWGITAIDYDNDGWVDLAAVGERRDGGEIRMFRNRGVDGFEDVTTELGLDQIRLANPRALVGADYDNDGDVDLLATENAGPALLLRNDGGNTNAWLRVNLEGLADNRSGIGTKVEMFSGILRQKVEIQASSGYLGQSALPITFGL